MIDELALLYCFFQISLVSTCKSWFHHCSVFICQWPTGVQ